jgi:hypothetical protein
VIKQIESRQGRKKSATSKGLRRHFLSPLAGLANHKTLFPTVETVGYFHVSLRDSPTARFSFYWKYFGPTLGRPRDVNFDKSFTIS